MASDVWLVGATVALLVALALHSVVCRFRVASALVTLVAVGVLIGAGLGSVLFAVRAGLPEILASLLVYALGVESYLFLYATARNSVGVGILLRLEAREMKPEEICSIYDPKAMVQRRIDRLVSAELIAPVGNGYRVTTKGDFLLVVFLWFRWVFRHPGKGYFG